MLENPPGLPPAPWGLLMVRPSRLVVLFALFTLLISPLAADEPKPNGNKPVPVPVPVPVSTVSPKSATFKDNIQPLLTKYCLTCHAGAKPSGKLDLGQYSDEKAIGTNRKIWSLVKEYVESGEMPPEDKPQPTEAEADLIARWIGNKLDIVSTNCQGQNDPGRVTMRRLNRTEYNNTIRDLIGVDFHPADDFPSDDVGYGFDNIGDVLTLPPLLMERYLGAAESIVEQAIIVDGKIPVKSLKSFASNTLLSSTADVVLDVNMPRDGDYLVKVTAYGQQAGPEVAAMAFKLDGKVLQTVKVPATEASAGTYEQKIKTRKGIHKVAASFTNDFYLEKGPGGKPQDRNLFIEKIEILGPLPRSTIDLPPSHKKIIFKNPTGPGDREVVARQVIEKFTIHAYRRPTRPAELDRLMDLYKLAVLNGESFEGGIRLAVEAVLVSPHFLFRVETERKVKRNNLEPSDLNDYELASRLSYFLWSSMPDDELFDLASREKLHDLATLEAQTRRMLKDPKARALTDNFAGQWLQLRNLKMIMPDPNRFPNWDDALRQSMLRETEMFFESVVKEDRSILEFLDSDYTYVNERLAKHYGIVGIKGENFRKIPLRDGKRGGLLTQASILTVTSNPTRTSPVKRGKWILEQVLGTPPPPPPPDIPELMAEEEKLKGSLREKMEKHRSNVSCATCHNRMDPLGFGFENYDAIGAWREKDGEYAVDSSGALPGGQTFTGPKELKSVLKTKDKAFTQCLTEKMLTYATGRGVEPSDSCVVETISSSVAKDSHKFSRLVVGVVTSDPFRKRTVEGAKKP